MQINVRLICSWNTRIMVVHSKHKYNVIEPLLVVHPLNLETLLFYLFPTFHLLTNSSHGSMDRTDADSSQDGNREENSNMMRLLQGMIESQQQQITLLREGLLTFPENRGQGVFLTSDDCNWRFYLVPRSR